MEWFCCPELLKVGPDFNLLDLLMLDWLSLGLLARSAVLTLVLGVPIVVVFETFRYGLLLGKRDMIHLAPIKVSGRLLNELGAGGVALALRAELVSIREAQEVLEGQPAPYIAPATGRDTGYYLVGLRKGVAPVQIHEQQHVKRVEQDIVLSAGGFSLPISALVNFLVDISGALLIPFRARYRKSLIRVHLVSAAGETRLTVSLPSRYAGIEPPWWRIRRPRLRTRATAFDRRAPEHPIIFTKTASTGTLRELHSLIRDAAFMILKIHDASDARDWLSMRYLMDGLDALNEYRRAGGSKSRDLAKDCFRQAALADPVHNHHALYFHGVMTMVERTAESIDQAIQHFLSASTTNQTQLRALIDTGVACCHAQRVHRLATADRKHTLLRADRYARKAESEWRDSLCSQEDVLTQQLCRLFVDHGPWIGSAAELLTTLSALRSSKTESPAPVATGREGWPRNPTKLVQRLHGLAPHFRRAGISVNIVTGSSGTTGGKDDLIQIDGSLLPHPLIPYTHALVSMVNEEEEPDHKGLDRVARFVRGAALTGRAIDLEPDNGMFYNNVGWALLKLVEWGGVILPPDVDLRSPLRRARRRMSGAAHEPLPWLHSPDWSEVPLRQGITLGSESLEYWRGVYWESANDQPIDGAEGTLIAPLCEEHLLQANALQPNEKLTHANLSLLYSTAWYRTGPPESYLIRARYHGMKAIQLDPEYINGHRDLAIVLVRYGELDEAFHYYTEALRLAEAPDKDREIINSVVSEVAQHGLSARKMKLWTDPKPELLVPRGLAEKEALHPEEPDGTGEQSQQ